MAKSKKSATKTTKTTKRTPKKPPTTTTKVRRTRADQSTTSGRSPLSDAVIIAAVALGIFLLVHLVIALVDMASGEEVVAPDENSKVENSKEGANGQDGEAASEATDNESQNGDTEDSGLVETENTYDFTSTPGESYTTMARRAVASVDGGLSPTERVAAETRLAQDAGDEWLAAGQDVSIAKNDVQSAVDWAKSLSAQQKAAWQPYADMIAW